MASFFLYSFPHSFCLPEIAPAPNLEQKLRFASSIIDTLEHDPKLKHSTANVRAYVFRAEVHMESGQLTAGLEDANHAIQLSSADQTIASNKLKAKAYRIVADIHEKNGQYVHAMDAYRGMVACDPSLRSKVTKEITRLQQLADAAN